MSIAAYIIASFLYAAALILAIANFGESAPLFGQWLLHALHMVGFASVLLCAGRMIKLLEARRRVTYRYDRPGPPYLRSNDPKSYADHVDELARARGLP